MGFHMTTEKPSLECSGCGGIVTCHWTCRVRLIGVQTRKVGLIPERKPVQTTAVTK